MRVTEGGARAQEAPGGPRSRRFGEAMRRARDGGASEARGAADREAAARAPGSRRVSADGRDSRLGKRREELREEERAASTGFAAHGGGHGTAIAGAGEIAGPADLRPVLRALPVAIDASRVREGAPLSLSLGRALDVDLRAAPAGVEVVLRPDPRLARAAAAELPALVAALRSRGIAVARAEVRARGGRAGTARRVDVSSPLR
jgi:hypothetical protein